MVAFDRGASLAHRFRVHAGDQTHLYGYALRALADDLDAGGPTSTVVRGYEDAPTGAVIQLRLLAGIFRLVLTGRAPTLQPYYPCLGGTADPSTVWPVLRPVLVEHADELHDALAIAPQTNEVGRSAALLAGLFDLVAASGRSRVRLLELGASAGLNLLLDRFHVGGEGWTWGPADSPVQLDDAVRGPIRPTELTIVAARGCDLDPVDATTEEGRLRLTSFVWPFDRHRHERLAAALRLAAAYPPEVDRAAAAEWLPDQLTGSGRGAAGDSVGQVPGPQDADPAGESLTVVWHSVTQLYWPAAELAAVEEILSSVGREHPLAEVGMEYDPDGAAGERPLVWTRLWHGDGRPPRRRLLGTAHDHGVPVVYRPVSSPPV